MKTERVLQSVESWQEKAASKNPTWREATEELATTLLSEEPMPKIFRQEENLTPEENQTPEENLTPEENPTSDGSSQPIADDNKQSENSNQDICRQEREIETEGQVASKPELECQSEKTLLVDSSDDVKENQIDDSQLIKTHNTPEAQKEPLEEVKLAELGSEVQPSVLSIDGVINEATKELIGAHLVTLSKKIMASLPHTRGDNDARVGRTTNYTWFCGYLVGFVVDDAHQVITAVVLGAGNTRQADLCKPALEAHIERVGIPTAVAADSASCNAGFIVFLMKTKSLVM